MVTAAALLAVAVGGLAFTGNLNVRMSSDEFVDPVPLWALLVPVAAAIVLTRLVPPRLAATDPLAELDRGRVRRELWILLAAAVGFPLIVVALMAAGVERDYVYLPAKVLLFLVAPLIVFRLFRGAGPKARAIPGPAGRMRWLAPIPAVVGWIYLAEFAPFSPPPVDRDGLPDAVTLAVVSLTTLLTASVLEEVFYRGCLQTRVETLLGRWPAIAVSSVQFAAMHIPSHVHAGSIGLGLATIVAAQGTFGLMQGYLWSRYRNLWAPIAIHIVVNLVYVDFLADALR